MSKKLRFFTFLIFLGSWFSLSTASAAAGNLTESYNKLFLIVTIISFIILAIVVFLFIWFTMKYGENKEGERKKLSHSTSAKLETAWTAIAAVTCIILMVFSFPFLTDLDEQAASASPDATQVIIEGTGTWQWHIHIPSENYSAVAVEDPVTKVKTTTAQFDVGVEYLFIFFTTGPWMHSFYSPELNFKMDVVPGVNNTMTIVFEETGIYHVLCSEFCGAGHSLMRAILEVS